MTPNAPTSPAASLVLGTGEQLALLGDVDDAGLPAEAYELGERAGRFTGERIFLTNPKLYHAVVRLLARGLPYREISEICGVSVNTVCGVSSREGVPIETIRERIGRLGLDVAVLTMEAIRDLLADPNWRSVATAKDLSIIHGISFMNAQLALGGATSRMETIEGAPSHEDYLKLIRNVTPAPTGLSDGTAGTKGNDAPAIEMPGERATLPASESVTPVLPSEKSN